MLFFQIYDAPPNCQVKAPPLLKKKDDEDDVVFLCCSF